MGTIVYKHLVKRDNKSSTFQWPRASACLAQVFVSLYMLNVLTLSGQLLLMLGDSSLWMKTKRIQIQVRIIVLFWIWLCVRVCIDERVIQSGFTITHLIGCRIYTWKLLDSNLTSVIKYELMIYYNRKQHNLMLLIIFPIVAK